MFSMTAFGSARASTAAGTVTVECRSVNNRFLDLNLRLPDDLRVLEARLRRQVEDTVKRGKVELRVSIAPSNTSTTRALDLQVLRRTAALLHEARAHLPDTPAPSLDELLRASSASDAPARLDVSVWESACLDACSQALQALQDNRQREGARLAQAMLAHAEQIAAIVNSVRQEQPQLLEEHREKLARKLREALLAANPEGFSHISGAELSARMAQESLLFSLRIDIAEELTRLGAHIEELRALLASDAAQTTGSVGKRLDFLFQEMNREANTLGSKSASVVVTRAAMDLKLLIEQLREQAQNVA